MKIGPIVVLASLLQCLSACGGGGNDQQGSSIDSGSTKADQAQRLQAAIDTAHNHASCVAIQPFWWEIGDGSGMLVGGGSPSTQTQYSRDSSMLIASASKWWWGAYVAELRQGLLQADDLKFLRMQSGYTHLSYATCLRLNADRQAAETVTDCLRTAANNLYSASDDGRFYYNGGHFQQQAVNLGLGGYNSSQLAAELGVRLGSELGIAYDSPQPAAGGKASAASYARFLQKLLRGELQLSSLLGSHPVCTNPSDASCTNASYTPIPGNESWHYSLGHWVEDDPVVGDGAFSSAGFFGFYPWISADRSSYGLIARHDDSGNAYAASMYCGRLIRKAYATGESP